MATLQCVWMYHLLHVATALALEINQRPNSVVSVKELAPPAQGGPCATLFS